MKKNLLAAIIIPIIVVLFVLFDEVVISFLSQFKTTHTLLMYSDFWSERVHDWLGDTVTLVGVMLAFSLPFVAQLVQWVVGTYGVTNFPDIAKRELRTYSLLKKMFLFVGLVIFWRLFIFDISPYTSSLYVLFNITIAALFLWIVWRLFVIVGFIIKCTFGFREIIVDPAYKYIKNITEDIPVPYNSIKDESAIPEVSTKYIQYVELLRDDEVSSFKRGNILINEGRGFEHFVWNYISALFITNNSNKTQSAIMLYMKLSSSIRKMCSLFGKEYYSRYVTLASSLAYQTIQNRYHTYDLYLTNLQEKENNHDHSLYEKELKEFEVFSKYYADILFLAEEIEGKNARDYYPILSCQYLLNHSTLAYYYFFHSKKFENIRWNDEFERINKWENDFMNLSQKLILIASRYKRSSALISIYKNVRNDLQFTHQREINLFSYINYDNDLSNEAYGIARKNYKIDDENKLKSCFNFLISQEVDKYFKIDDDKKSELLQNLLRIRYKFKVDKLLLFWLGHLSFDTSIVLKVLEEASPIDSQRVHDVGAHLIPTDIAEVFKKYLIIYDLDFEYRSGLDDLEGYQVTFSTMVLYFLLKELKKDLKVKGSSDNEDLNLSYMAREIYDSRDVSIRNVKTIVDIVTLWKSSPRGLESNQGIMELCLNYGISFEKLKNFYNLFLTSLIETADETIKSKILKASIDEELIQEFYEELNNKSKKVLNNYKFNIVPAFNLINVQRYRFMVISREWFIEAETGVHYVRDNLSNQFYYQFKSFLEKNMGKTLYIVDENDTPQVTFSYREVADKIFFYCEYNFYFGN